MWSKTNSEANPDSDQSISEEEEDAATEKFAGGFTTGGASAAVKEGIRLQSQLDQLIGFSSDEEVEIPVFHGERKLVSSPATVYLDEDILSDDEGNKLHLTSSITSAARYLQPTGPNIPRREIQGGACTWSAVTKEAEALANEVEKTKSCLLHEGTSRVNKLSKGVRSKGKSKLMFRFQSRKEIVPSPISEVDTSSKVLFLPEEDIPPRDHEKSVSQILGNFDGEKIERSDTYGLEPEVGRRREHTMNSVSEILDSYRVIDERNFSSSDEKALDSDDRSEGLESGSSSDHEANDQNLGLVRPEVKQKTMADKFQDAFGASSLYDEGPHFALHGLGIFEKLQQVMNIEKKQEKDFLQRLETGTCLEGIERCMDVEILSRCLEAKLTVCCCTLSRIKESSTRAERLDMGKDNKKTLTIIFSSRACEDVELEVGTSIRIFSPWKETQVTAGKGEVIILATYFSQISA